MLSTLLCFLSLSSSAGNDDILQSYKTKSSGIQVSGNGVVIRLLADDLQGSRHQRFILKLSKHHTVLIAHNIDLAKRIQNLKMGDKVAFHGQYEWNAKGGVVHWTHHDPQNIHTNGWLKHQGKIFQ